MWYKFKGIVLKKLDFYGLNSLEKYNKLWTLCIQLANIENIKVTITNHSANVTSYFFKMSSAGISRCMVQNQKFTKEIKIFKKPLT